ncbi:MAG: sigma-E factor negative regulatory protein [Pseudomonadota bacterium]|nr:sigma-E factor negative regulatory protein [Pseudomonadota bacterium]
MNTPTPTMPDAFLDHDEPDACLSAFVDGEADAAEQACARWRDEPAARRTWHAYHLIGDVMRSEELAASPLRDAAFLAGLQARLAAEPVVLAPSVTSPPPPRQRRNWLMPVAAAAGFVVVAGVLVVTRTAAPDAASQTAPMQLAVETAMPAPRASEALVMQGQQSAANTGSDISAVSAPRDLGLIRDARLDEYLRAHQAAGGLAVATPGGWLRRVDAVVPQPER